MVKPVPYISYASPRCITLALSPNKRPFRDQEVFTRAAVERNGRRVVAPVDYFVWSTHHKATQENPPHRIATDHPIAQANFSKSKYSGCGRCGSDSNHEAINRPSTSVKKRGINAPIQNARLNRDPCAMPIAQIAATGMVIAITPTAPKAPGQDQRAANATEAISIAAKSELTPNWKRADGMP